MSSRPRLRDPSKLIPGLAAVALFGVLVVAFLGASFDGAAGFPDGANITASIGYAMFDITGDALGGDVSVVPSESFLVAFLVIALVLDAALEGSVMLASREAAGQLAGALRTDGGEEE